MRSQDTLTQLGVLYIPLAKSTPSAPRIAQLVEHLTVVVTSWVSNCHRFDSDFGDFFYGTRERERERER